ncbi:MAG: cation-translocating P-type ATPase [Clostridia bacterium]|nr:cation-translocating P-type ATPase [Clostridia bacterium]
MYAKLSADETAKRVDVDIKEGLSSTEVEERLSASGANSIRGDQKTSFISMVLKQLNEPMIYILFAAAILSALVGEWSNSLVILAIVVLNAIIGVVQENKAEKALEALKKLTVTHAIVRRGGIVQEISADDLVVGDVVLLDAGRVVPADLRLTFASNLAVNESALTGESVPVSKDPDFIADGDIPLGDRANMAFQGTVVTGGRGEGIVVATGMSTEVGRIADMLNEQDAGKTPLQKKLAGLSKILGIAAIGACALILLIGLLQGKAFAEILLTSISLAVAVVPEGLTAVVTIVLAMGVTRMVKRNAIVRHLPAVETLGSVSVICSDKTGTLTQNKMTVVSAYFNGVTLNSNSIAAKDILPLIHGFTLCNDATVNGEAKTGDPTEIALIDFAIKHGISPDSLNKTFPRIDEIPFDSERKMMTTVHSADGTTISYTKGALDMVIPNCTHIWDNGDIRPITDEDIRQIQDTAKKMSDKALRVLALAMRSGNHTPKEENLAFTGLVAMMDPPRKEAIESIKICKRAGIRVVMITGDHKATATAIGIQTGICKEGDTVLSGAELDNMSDEELSACIENVCVFARVDPRHKVRIVAALKAHGHVVSMTGDGVNDAPSLKAADIGVAMGITGTDAAKDASSLILTDDNFSTIANAVEEGRNIFENIRKSIYFLLSSNMGELITVLVSVLLFWDTPLLPLHILWINLITDSLPALALGIDPGSPDVMNKKPRPADQSLFADGGGFKVIFYGIIIAIVTLCSFKITQVTTENLNYAQTMALVTLAGSQLVYSITVRAGDKSVFGVKILNNPLFITSLVVGFALQFLILYIPPLATLFSTSPLSFGSWGVVIGVSLVPLVAHEIVVLVRKFLK